MLGISVREGNGEGIIHPSKGERTSQPTRVAANPATAVYTTTASLLDYLRAAYAPDAEVKYDERLDLLTNARVLCLDEFDRFNSTEWAQEKFFQLVEARYQRGEELLTCFAGNKALDELAPYLQSRMEDRQCYLFELKGKDVRQRKR